MSKEGDDKEAAAKKGGAAGKDGDGFLDPEECIMIFGGFDAICSKHLHKVCYRQACAAETAVPSFLSWSESPITFDQTGTLPARHRPHRPQEVPH